jgi:hypothetical protein
MAQSTREAYGVACRFKCAGQPSKACSAVPSRSVLLRWRGKGGRNHAIIRSEHGLMGAAPPAWPHQPGARGARKPCRCAQAAGGCRWRCLSSRAMKAPPLAPWQLQASHYSCTACQGEQGACANDHDSMYDGRAHPHVRRPQGRESVMVALHWVAWRQRAGARCAPAPIVHDNSRPE